MKFITTILIFLFFKAIYTATFSEALLNLRKLESYIKQYKDEKQSKVSLNHLILSYIREGKYKGTAWTLAAGSPPSDLEAYIKALDTEKNTNAASCRGYGEIVLPSKEKMDFVHLFATMNGIDHSNSFTDGFSALVGWGGDAAQLAQDLKKFNGTLDQLLVEANKLLGVKGQFGEGDLISDLDAPIILEKKKDNNTFANIIEEYYKGDEWKSRVPKFVKLTFPTVTDKTQLRQVVFDRYNKDGYIQILECQYGIRVAGRILGCYSPHAVIAQYKNHQKAAVYAFADYLKKRL